MPLKKSAENSRPPHKSILLTGGSGFIGSHLVPVLLAQGYNITVLTRYPDKTARHFNYAVTAVEQLAVLQDDNFDVVINLAGQGITDKRWTPEIKKQLRDSRIITTRKLLNYLQNKNKKTELLISGSAVGYYGLSESDELLDETSSADASFSSRLCADWESEARHAEALAIRTCYLRTGIVLGKSGGALRKMLPPFKMGLGGPMGSGKQWMSWIHIDDLLAIVLCVINNKEIKGAINATAPNPVTNKDFSSILGRRLKRPAFLPMPAFILKIMLGEMAVELLLSGQRVIPKKMLDAGYKFQYAELDDALSDLV